MIPRLSACAALLLSSYLASAAPAPASSSSLSASPATATNTNLNASLASVCTPSECVQGANTLTAGSTILTPINSTLRSTVLLPGTYTSYSSATANSSFLAFGTSSTSRTSPGFSSSGTIGSTYTVSLFPGLTTYTSPLYKGFASYLPLSNSSNATTASIESFLLSDNVWAVLQVGGASGSRVVAWDSVAEVGNLVGGSGGVEVVDMQSSSCSTPCASGGVCVSNSTCSCCAGFVGATCDTCAAGFFGKDCQACPVGCGTCDEGITGTGRCLVSATTNSTAAACNCINGVCESAKSTSTCGCNAGWSKAANGTQCAACANGYFASASGDCLACDPSCATCAGPTGTCLTCLTSLQPLSADKTKCTTASSQLSNGTFVSCASRTFFDSTTQGCVECDALCETCWNGGSGGCLSCRAPNGLLDGECVGVGSKTGVCNSSGVLASSSSVVGANAGWVFDNAKGECDALPAKCTAGSIDNFSAASTRAQLTCSACLAGAYLSNGACVTSCPAGTTASEDGKSCEACDSSCSTCSGSTTYCTACSDSSRLSLDGACINGPSCPASYFAPPNNATCLSCHPDCATCGTTFDTCLTCPSSRPVLSSSGTCLQTCSTHEYFDTAKGSCVACSSECATCSGGGDGACMSCSSTTTLKQGSCVDADCTVVAGFGVCLSSLVTVSSTSSTSSSTKSSLLLPWWTILLTILGALALLGLIGMCWRRKEQKRRRLQTARFANDLGNKEVDMKLRALPTRVAYPPPPTAEEVDEVPLTPRFVIEDHRMQDLQERARWSQSSYGSKRTVAPLVPQETGASLYSQRSGFTTTSGKKLAWGDRNPFNKT